MNTNLTGKVILITGQSGGIGSAIARAFAGEGAKLVLHYHRNLAGARKLQRELATVEPFLVCADLTKESQVRNLFARPSKRFRRVDTLVANAGSWETRDVPLYRLPLKQWRGTLDGVLTSTFLCLREFFRLVAKQKRGNAVLIRSTAAVFGEANNRGLCRGKGGDGIWPHAQFEERIVTPRAPHAGLLRRTDQLRVPRMDGRATQRGEASSLQNSPQSHPDDGAAPDCAA